MSGSGAPRTVGLLGGSFNPPHVAHVMAAWWALATQGLDAVWLVPTWRHAFGKPLAPFDDRVRMCELAVEGVSGLAVSRAEEELRDDPLVGRTVRTLEHLHARFPGTRFALVVGADIVAEAPRWYRWERIEELARVVVVGRQGAAEVPGAPSLPAVSSTTIRARISQGAPVDGLVPARVASYVRERGLYRTS